MRQYIRVKRIPRGLRSQIITTYDDLEADLLVAWERELTDNSNRLMGILIENYDRKVSQLLKDIDLLEQEIKKMNLSEATEKNFAILNDIIQRYLSDIKQQKTRKLKMDEHDYSSGRMFTFAKKYDHLVPKDSQPRSNEGKLMSSS